MKKKLILLIALYMLHPCISYGWGGDDATGEKPNFFGKLTSQEGNTFNVTNITIGRSKAGGRVITMYEMPQVPGSTAGKDRIKIPGNPHHDLTTTELDLIKVKKIGVPNPRTSWIWEKPQAESRAPSIRFEFIELSVTWKNNQTTSYLLELGTENTTKPIKIFCDTTGDKPISFAPGDSKPMFCEGVQSTELRKTGAPFPSIKELIIEGYCYEAPANGNNVGRLKQPEAPAPAPEPAVIPEPEPIQSTPQIEPEPEEEVVEIETAEEIELQPAPAPPAEPATVTEEVEIEVPESSETPSEEPTQEEPEAVPTS